MYLHQFYTAKAANAQCSQYTQVTQFYCLEFLIDSIECAATKKRKYFIDNINSGSEIL